MREISILKDRIIQFLDLQGIKKSEFYRDTGVSNGILSQSNGLSEDNLMRFLNNYSQISPEWLLTGNGEMLKPTGSENAVVEAEPSIIIELQSKIIALQEENVKLQKENFKLKEENTQLKAVSPKGGTAGICEKTA